MFFFSLMLIGGHVYKREKEHKQKKMSYLHLRAFLPKKAAMIDMMSLKFMMILLEQIKIRFGVKM